MEQDLCDKLKFKYAIMTLFINDSQWQLGHTQFLIWGNNLFFRGNRDSEKTGTSTIHCHHGELLLRPQCCH
jgi:hypothetical protein